MADQASKQINEDLRRSGFQPDKAYPGLCYQYEEKGRIEKRLTNGDHSRIQDKPH